jgi:cation transport ATPase
MALTITQRTRTRIAFLTGAMLLVALGFAQFAAPVGTTWRDGMLIASSILAGLPITVRAWQALRVKAFSIDLLVTIAVVGALFIGEYVESAVVSFLFLFGAWLEGRSLERTRASLRELVDLAPTRATVLRGGERVVVDADDVALGETVLVTNGERIAVDAVVTTGRAEVTEASITGEPIPVTKSAGDRVFAGTIAESGYLELVADRVGDETTFARIIELVEEAQESRTRRQRFLERFAQFYTPAIVVHVAVDGHLAGLVAIADEIRPEAAAALREVRRSGIRHLVMLTGDNAHTAQLVGDRLGLDEVHAGLLPEDKARIVAELRANGRRVAMVGDGVNDAPALATADVGVAMGAGGTDVSMETADIVLMADRLDQLAHARRVARATVRVMKQNTALALVTVGLLVAGVLAHVIQLAGGMLVHEISVLLVILNALRLVRLRGPERDASGAGGAVERPREAAWSEEKEPVL